MIQRHQLFPFSFALAALFAVAAVQQPTPPVILPPEQAAKEGRALVDEMLSQPPDANTVTGVLAIRRPGKPYTEIPIRFQTAVTPTNWVSVYQAKLSDKMETVTVVHAPGQPNIYYSGPNRFTFGGSEYPLNYEPAPLSAKAILAPFAGSDFSIADLGLEFLHWPDQKLLQKEMKRSRSCRVLESTNPHPTAGGYAKVKSWVDNESHGILLAQAFDVKGNKIKEFLPGDFSKSKATGQWQLGKMQITDLQTDSSTTVRFDVDK